MRCSRCEKAADLGVNDEPLCYDRALEEGDEAVAAAKFHAELYAAREENRQLRERISEQETEVDWLEYNAIEPCYLCGNLPERCRCTVTPRAIRLHVTSAQSTLETETTTLLLAAASMISRIWAELKAARYAKQRVAELEAEVERLKASVPIPTVVSSTVTKARRALRTVLGVASPGSAFRQAADLAIGALTSLEAERDQLRARVAELEAEVGSLRRRDTGLVVTTNKIIDEFDTVRSKLEVERDQLQDRVTELESALRNCVRAMDTLLCDPGVVQAVNLIEEVP